MNNFRGQGFHLTATKHEPITLALISLKTALQSYFKTQKNIAQAWTSLGSNEPTDKASLDVFYRRTRNGMTYIENYVETIIHFHHFVELMCIELLRMEHSSLATEQCKESESHKEVYKRIRKLPNDASTRTIDSTIGFDKAIKRLHALISDDNITTRTWLNNPNLAFVDKTAKESMLQLLALRNLLLHQGTFILEYDYLDLFVGTKVLPFIINIIQLPEFSIYNHLWRHPEIACMKTSGDRVDPISEIVLVCKNHYNREHIAFLKELGRSAYQNLIPNHEPPKSGFGASMGGNPVRIAARDRANRALKEEDVYGVRDCLVCGERTLVLYEHSEMDIPRSVVEARCTNCTFSIDKRFQPHKYDINVLDLWISI
jgi:transcription elongation factor Elf1